MKKWYRSEFYYHFLITVSMILAIIFYTGIVITNDLTGRIILGSIWLVVSIGWLSKYFNMKKVKKQAESY